MTTVTTTSLSWSASWFQGTVPSDADDGQGPLQHGSAVVSDTSESSGVVDGSDPDQVSLSSEAADYLNTQGTQIGGSAGTGTIQKIYDTLAQVITSSSTSDAQKWAAYVTSDEMRFEIDAHGGSAENGIETAFDQETANTSFMQTINAGLQDISKRNLTYDGQQPVSIPLERSLLYLQQREEQANEEEMWGSSSLSINIQENTVQTASGTQTSFTLSSSFSGEENVLPSSSLPTLNTSVATVDRSQPYNFTPQGNTTSIVGHFDNMDGMNAELDREIVDELFASPSNSASSASGTSSISQDSLNTSASDKQDTENGKTTQAT